MIDLYEDMLKEALYLKPMNIAWLKRDQRYDPAKPTIWLQLLGLFETYHIIQKYRINNDK